jgi:hypothetical protein
VLALVMAPIYAYSMVYVPVAQLAFLLPLAYGAGLGALTAFALRVTRTRSTFLAVGVALLATGFSYALSWPIWAYATLARAEVDVGVLDVLFPPSFLAIIAEIYSVGAWSIGSGGTPVSGLMLGVCWALEAVFVLGASPIAAAVVGGNGVFCERCQSWCRESRGLLVLPAALQGEIAPRLDDGDLRVLTEVPRAQWQESSLLRMDLDSCMGCGETHTMTLVHVLTTQNGNRQEQNETVVVDHRLITREQADWIRQTR